MWVFMKRLWVYIKGLIWPSEWIDFADLMTKTVVAIAVAAAAFLFNHYQEAAKARDVAEAEARIEAEESRNAIGMFVNVMPKQANEANATQKLELLNAYCFRDKELRQRAIAAETRPFKAAEWMRAAMGRPSAVLNEPAAPERYRYAVRDVLCASVTNYATSNAPAASKDAAKATDDAKAMPVVYVTSEAARRLNATMTAADAGSQGNGDWFAVLATVPATRADFVKALSDALEIKMRDAKIEGPVVIYRTKSTGDFALTAGGALSEQAARDRATLLRATGVVPDAFAQPDRQWTRTPVSG